MTNNQVKVAAWVWWLLFGALLIAFLPPDGTVNDLLLVLSGLPLVLAYGVPYWKRVYAKFREGYDEESEERVSTRHYPLPTTDAWMGQVPSDANGLTSACGRSARADRGT